MSHRVLLDFNCPASQLQDGQPLPADVSSLLAMCGWETAVGPQADDVLQRMAEELPTSDLPSFLRNTRFQMLNKAPHAELTVGYFTDSNVGKLRVRIRADRNTAIAELGKRTATQLLALLELELKHMDLFESRNAEPIAQGREVAEPAYRLFGRSNLATTVPLVFSLSSLLVGAIIAVAAFYLDWSLRILGDTTEAWYGRLFGPLLMAVVTTSAVIARDRKGAGTRRAEWNL